MKNLPLIIIIMFLAVGFFSEMKKSDTPVSINYQQNAIEITKEDKVEKEKFMVAQFSADWCGPCRQLKYLIKNDEDIKKIIKEKYSEWMIIDIEDPENKEWVDLFKPSTIPLVVKLKLKDGKWTEVERFLGSRDKDFLIKWLNKLPKK
mgnify:CR=1 FL=1|tara:strand:- start:1175 stop:1618 length:444 start_codon:yes stop_codon:yes gene_type:complete